MSLLDATVEMHLWVLIVGAAIFFLLGCGAREARDARRHRCARCRSNARHHQRLATRPAWHGFPGHHVTAFPYGDSLDPAVLDGWEPLPSTAPAPPSDEELAAWLAEDQAQSLPLTVEAIAVEWICTQIEADTTSDRTEAIA